MPERQELSRSDVEGVMGWEGVFLRLRCDRCDTVEEFDLYDKHGTHYPRPDDDEIMSWGWKSFNCGDLILCGKCEQWEDIPISSTAITRAAYYPEVELLRVEFPSGNVFVYEDVPVSVIAGLKQAKSAGKYFNAHIKDVYSSSPDEWDS